MTEQQLLGLDSTNAPAQRRPKFVFFLGHLQSFMTGSNSGLQVVMTNTVLFMYTFRFKLNMLLFSESRQCDSAEVGTFLSMPTAEFVSDLRSPGLPQEDLDEEGIFSVG